MDDADYDAQAAKRVEHLNDLTHRELLGEDAVDRLREDNIAWRVEQYRESLAEMDDDELFGDSLDELRERKIDELVSQYMDGLEEWQ